MLAHERASVVAVDIYLQLGNQVSPVEVSQPAFGCGDAVLYHPPILSSAASHTLRNRLAFVTSDVLEPSRS